MDFLLHHLHLSGTVASSTYPLSCVAHLYVKPPRSPNLGKSAVTMISPPHLLNTSLTSASGTPQNRKLLPCLLWRGANLPTRIKCVFTRESSQGAGTAVCIQGFWKARLPFSFWERRCLSRQSQRHTLRERKSPLTLHRGRSKFCLKKKIRHRHVE